MKTKTFIDGLDLDIKSLLSISGGHLLVLDKFGSILFHHKSTNSPNYPFIRPLEIGTTFIETLTPEMGVLVSEIIGDVMLWKKPYRTELKFVDAEDRLQYLEASYYPVFQPGENVAHIYVMLRDTTDQKVFERKLRTEAQNISDLIEKANAIIIGLDARGYIIDWNAHSSRITGYKKNEVYATRFSEMLLPEEKRQSFEEILAKISQSQKSINYEITLLCKDGREITALMSGTQRITNTGRTIGITFVGQDVTELMEYRRSLEIKVKERTDELFKALKKEKDVVALKNRFVSMASHEFRTPLSTIKLCVGHIKKESDNKSNIDIRLSEIEKQVENMIHLLDDVLLYGKSEAKKIELHPTPISLNEFITKIIDEIEGATGNTHQIRFRYVGLRDHMNTDERLLRNILTNLLTNAIKFSPGKQTVSLNVNHDVSRLVINVGDEGMGIAPQDMKKIFEPFRRGSYVEHISGTGLGLAIVKKAVELLNGTIALESDQDRGTEFTVIIPDQYG